MQKAVSDSDDKSLGNVKWLLYGGIGLALFSIISCGFFLFFLLRKNRKSSRRRKDDDHVGDVVE